MLVQSKENIKNAVLNKQKYILVVRSNLEKIVEILNFIEKIDPNKYILVNTVNSNILFNWCILKRND